MKLKNKKGFTLVELLVVIAIIGILAVVAVPALFKNINKAKVADVEADYNAIKSACLSYYTDKNKMPEHINELSSYMDSVPNDSSFGGTYSIGNINVDGNEGNELVLIISGGKISTEQRAKLDSDLGAANVVDSNENLNLILINNTNM